MGAPLTAKRKGPGNTRAKGKRLVKLAKTIFEAQGALVETAPLQSKRLPNGLTISIASDYFGCWDLVVVWEDGRRGFVQVTTWEHCTDRRRKIRERGFPCTAHDAIFGYKAGPDAHFKVLHGPDFVTANSERVELAEDATDDPAERGEDASIIAAAEC